MDLFEKCPKCDAGFEHLESVVAFGATMQFCNRCATRWVVEGEDTPGIRDKITQFLISSRGPTLSATCAKCGNSYEMPEAMLAQPGAAVRCPRCGNVWGVSARLGMSRGQAKIPPFRPGMALAVGLAWFALTILLVLFGNVQLPNKVRTVGFIAMCLPAVAVLQGARLALHLNLFLALLLAAVGPVVLGIFWF